jgi:biotin transport system substrate-specific component
MQAMIAKMFNRTDEHTLIQQAAMVLVGSLLLAVSAKVQVPFWPVPMTMQTLVVLMIGAHAGKRIAGATVLAYLLEGAAGLPVFSTGAGLAFMVGPTGGYLLGFLVSAMIVSLAVERGFTRRLPFALAVFVLADLAILTLGVAWLSTLIGIEKAVMVGAVPFLPAEALKIALATASLFVVRRFSVQKIEGRS